MPIFSKLSHEPVWNSSLLTPNDFFFIFHFHNFEYEGSQMSPHVTNMCIQSQRVTLNPK